MEGEQKFGPPSTPEEENRLILARSEYLLEQLGTDRLTGLKNRTFFERELEHALQAIRAAGEGHHRHGGEPLREISIIFIDLDNFKQVNDMHGHLEGDSVLQKFAKVLSESVRGADVVARFGGDEFYVLLPRTSESNAAAVAEKIRANLEKSAELSSAGVSASLGVATAGSINTPDAEELIRRADAAAVAAKQAGKNRVKVYKAL